MHETGRGHKTLNGYSRQENQQQQPNNVLTVTDYNLNDRDEDILIGIPYCDCDSLEKNETKIKAIIDTGATRTVVGSES